MNIMNKLLKTSVEVKTFSCTELIDVTKDGCTEIQECIPGDHSLKVIATIEFITDKDFSERLKSRTKEEDESYHIKAKFRVEDAIREQLQKEITF